MKLKLKINQSRPPFFIIYWIINKSKLTKKNVIMWRSPQFLHSFLDATEILNLTGTCLVTNITLETPWRQRYVSIIVNPRVSVCSSSCNYGFYCSSVCLSASPDCCLAYLLVRLALLPVYLSAVSLLTPLPWQAFIRMRRFPLVPILPCYLLLKCLP